ncbi:MAG: hypothetical protein HYU77_15715 [Betaproteobacteria bacterium]|nr:hypothetical protein [Betaproteobacteria bacterium]
MFHSMHRKWPVIGRLILAVALFTQFVYAAQACLLPQSALSPVFGGVPPVNCETQPGTAGVACDELGPGSSNVCLANLTRSDQSAASVFEVAAPAVSDAAVPTTARSDVVPFHATPRAELWTRFSSPPLPILFRRFQT